MTWPCLVSYQNLVELGPARRVNTIQQSKDICVVYTCILRYHWVQLVISRYLYNSELTLAGWKVRIGLDWSIKNLELEPLIPKYYALLSSLGLHLLLVYSWVTGTIGIEFVSTTDNCKIECHFLWPIPFLCKGSPPLRKVQFFLTLFKRPWG